MPRQLVNLTSCGWFRAFPIPLHFALGKCQGLFSAEASETEPRSDERVPSRQPAIRLPCEVLLACTERTHGDEPVALARFRKDDRIASAFRISLETGNRQPRLPRLREWLPSRRRSMGDVRHGNQAIATSNAEHAFRSPLNAANSARFGHINNSLFVRDMRLPVPSSLLAVML